MRYYSTQRPIGPGTFPKPQGNAVKEVFNFDSKTYCEEVGREAWATSSTNSPSTTGLQRTTSSSRTVLAARAASMRRPAETWTAAGIAAAIRAESRETSTGTVGQGEVICKMLV